MPIREKASHLCGTTPQHRKIVSSAPGLPISFLLFHHPTLFILIPNIVKLPVGSAAPGQSLIWLADLDAVT